MGKSIIIKKEKGQIAEVEKIKRSNFIPYFTKKDKCFENILSQEDIIKLPSKEKSEIIRKAKSITNELNAHCSLNETSNIIKKINEAKTEEELLQIVNDILKQYYLIPLSFYTSTIVNDILKQNHLIPLSLYTSTKKITKNKVNNNVKYIEKSLINNKKATISIMIKEMIMTYYTNLLLRLPERTIRELENKKINTPINEIFASYTQKNNINNGIYELSQNIFADLIDIIYTKSQNHLCFSCQNATATLCPKIKDRIKSRIDSYDFITEGIQEIKENGEMKKFIVSKCDNYKKDEVRSTPTERLEKLKKLKESIKILYFGGEDIEEANRLQYQEYKHGNLIMNGVALHNMNKRLKKRKN